MSPDIESSEDDTSRYLTHIVEYFMPPDHFISNRHYSDCLLCVLLSLEDNTQYIWLMLVNNTFCALPDGKHQTVLLCYKHLCYSIR